MKRGIYILNRDAFERVYTIEEQRQIDALIDVEPRFHTSAAVVNNPTLLHDVQIIFSGWGGPRIDAAFLSHAPALELVLYGAGSIRPIVTDAFWERGVRICSSYSANAIPVAEYTLAMIVLLLKQTFRLSREIREQRGYIPMDPEEPIVGAYGSTVGVVSLGMAGRRVCQLLKQLSVEVVAYDPYVTQAQADALGVRMVALDELFCSSDVVTLHTPLLPQTENLIRGEHISSMKAHAGFINASRGAVVCESELIDALRQRRDIQAVLDVTNPEPPDSASPLYDLPNVLLTPHIAGSLGRECRRMGQYMIDECRRYLNGEPLQWEISRERAQILG